MSIYVPSTPTFHPHVLRCGRHSRSTLTASAGTGMVRLAVVRCLHARARSPGGAKQPYGVRPARTLPGQRAAAVSQAAPQKPLRTVRRLFKATGSTPARGDGPRPATPPGNRDPGRVGATAAAPHRPSSCLARRAGRPKPGDCRTRVRMCGMHRSRARGPIQSQRGRACDASGQRDSTGSCPTPLRPVRAFALAAPVRRHSSPRRAGVFHR